MECLKKDLTKDQQKMLMIGGMTMMAGSALYWIKKSLSGSKPKREEFPAVPDSYPMITLPAIVSDVDGVVLRAKDPVIGSKDCVVKLLSPFKDSKRSIPFTFFTNAGGAAESTKAAAMNNILGLTPSSMIGRLFNFSQGPKL